ncbi:MarR family winged helix-turn-helix transcriptional regulator [Agromyces albus]|uniref:MarR family winged helix-turn-helix transcriptional regulator n=1 Tax=Agromyces albus TaxID=205332 RepID=UPI0027D7E2A3|nr:MarR family winged helix-turn-helix transcriptional regulator [Agromyces albus]
MNGSRQVPPGERSGSDGQADPNDPVALIEAALVAMRRDQGRRRLQRRAEANEQGFGHVDGDASGHAHAHDEHAHEEHFRGHGHRRGGRWASGPDAGDAEGDAGLRHPHHHGGRRGDGLAQAARFRLLDALEGTDRPPSVSELADAIGVDQPRASRLVQAAVDAGHARREADPADARRSAIVLTAAGRKLLADARGTRRNAVVTALADFTPDERAELARLLSRFVAAWPRD